MRRLLYRPFALEDLVDIYRHIARDNPNRALTFTDELRAQCAKLEALPGSLGRPRPELHPDVRSFAYKGCVIIFRYRDDVFEVIDIFEGHRDIEAYFERHRNSI